MRIAFENGINFFDNAETYSAGLSEEVMGRSIKNNSFKREDLVISTKLYFGYGGWGPNATGLSKKHLVEGLNASLKRLQLDYVDLVFAHRPDPQVPMEEIVCGFNHLINQGKAFYWGTSEWSAQEITEAHAVAQRLGLEGPVMEQPEYNIFTREKVEKEYLPIFENFGLGTTTWCPLASGVLTGKYTNGIPKDSRFHQAKGIDKIHFDWYDNEVGRDRIKKVPMLAPIADKLGCTLPQLALAWCISNPKVSSVIAGFSKVAQLEENLKCIEFISKLTPEIMHEIDQIFDSKPAPLVNFRG
jgi:voltage-dependent potassium channel beta subunit